MTVPPVTVEAAARVSVPVPWLMVPLLARVPERVRTPVPEVVSVPELLLVPDTVLFPAIAVVVPVLLTPLRLPVFRDVAPAMVPPVTVEAVAPLPMVVPLSVLSRWSPEPCRR